MKRPRKSPAERALTVSMAEVRVMDTNEIVPTEARIVEERARAQEERVQSFRRRLGREGEAAIGDGLYVIGHWWIDDLTNEDVVFVVNTDRPWVWLPMDELVAGQRDPKSWIEHFSFKTWRDRGEVLNDLEVALLVGMHLQRSKKGTER